MRIVFMGTPDFAVPSLKALLDNGYNVVGVFCQPDRPKGRGNKMTACPVKELALSAGIPVFQPERIKRAEGVEMLKSLRDGGVWPAALSGDSGHSAHGHG